MKEARQCQGMNTESEILHRCEREDTRSCARCQAWVCPAHTGFAGVNGGQGILVVCTRCVTSKENARRAQILTSYGERLQAGDRNPVGNAVDRMKH